MLASREVVNLTKSVTPSHRAFSAWAPSSQQRGAVFMNQARLTYQAEHVIDALKGSQGLSVCR